MSRFSCGRKKTSLVTLLHLRLMSAWICLSVPLIVSRLIANTSSKTGNRPESVSKSGTTGKYSDCKEFWRVAQVIFTMLNSDPAQTPGTSAAMWTLEKPGQLGYGREYAVVLQEDDI